MAADLRAMLEGGRVSARRRGVLRRGLDLLGRNRALTELLVEQRSQNAELQTALRRAEQSQRTAETERDKAQAATRLLVETLGAADPESGGRDVRVADVLARAAERAQREFDAHPPLRAAVLLTIVQTYDGLGLFAEAVAIGREALARARRDLGEEAGETVELLSITGTAIGESGGTEEAVEMLRSAVEACDRADPVAPHRRLEIRASYAQGLAEAGRLDEAIAQLRIALDDVRVPAEHPSRAFAHHNLGLALVGTGAAEEGTAALRAAYEGRRRAFGPRSALALRSLSSLGHVLHQSGRTDEAETCLREAADACATLFGERHPATVNTRHNLAGVLLALGRTSEAAHVQEDAHAAAADAFGPESAQVVMTALQLARIHTALGNAAASADAARRARDIAIRAGRADLVEAARMLIGDEPLAREPAPD